MNKKTKLFFLGILGVLLLSLIGPLIHAIPTGPVVTYVANSTVLNLVPNRSVDLKGTITVVNLTSNQQDYKWKAYVGNVSGSLVLDDANSKSIYDWSMANAIGEIYVTRTPESITWGNVICANQTIIDNEQSLLGMSSAMMDSINATFGYAAHKSFLIGTRNITNSSCRSTATYINDTAQTVNEAAYFQEVLLMDPISSGIVYTTIIESNHLAYDGANDYDFQMLVAENESSNTPLMYYFYLELG